MLVIALGGVVYVLDTESGGSSSLCNTGSETTYISSVRWNKSGKYLAVGTSDAEVQVYTCTHAFNHHKFLIIIITVQCTHSYGM